MCSAVLMCLQDASVVDSDEVDEGGESDEDEDEEEGLSWEELEEEAKRCVATDRQSSACCEWGKENLNPLGICNHCHPAVC